MTRSQLINLLIAANKYATYLEIGVNTRAQPGWNFDNVNVAMKHGVDPEEKVGATFQTTSDEFFKNRIKMKYDIIFIDGLHLFEQAHKDIMNSLKWLSDNGTIVVHDCNPQVERTQKRHHALGAWHGDVWKAILKLRMEEPNLTIYTVDTDEGCAVIQRGTQKLFTVKDPNTDIYNFTFFDAHRKNILNLISVRQFKKIMRTDGWVVRKAKAARSLLIRGIKKAIRA